VSLYETRNPWTKEIEYILCKNYLLITQQKVAVTEGSGGSLAESGDMEFFSRDVNNQSIKSFRF
jgi:hypothetical protein